MPKRDDFPKSVKESLARRVGFMCSNPDCQKLTIGPDSKPMGSVSIGVAAHITAAAPGGKRYDPTLTKEERKRFDNGIWLCQNCAKLIDSDELKYTIGVLQNWKIDAENRARKNLESGTGHSSPRMDRTLVAQAALLEQLGEMLSGETDKTIGIMRNTWREGYKNEVRDQLTALKSDQDRWNILSNKVKAKVLRFEAGLILDNENGLLDAKNLADQAYILDPSDENQSKIRALIARQEGSLSNAIQYLENNKDIDSRNMLAALYLELGENFNCRKVLDEIHVTIANAETFRLRALLYLFDKDIKQARIDINNAERLAPSWYVVKLNRAMIDYFSAISNAVLPNRPILWPEPVTPDLVKHDIESVSHLQNAIKLFEELSKFDNQNVDAEIIKNWQLACRLVYSAKEDDLTKLIRVNLKSNPADYYLIIWALELNYEFDFAASENALLTLLGSGGATIFHVIALAGLHVRSGAWVNAEKILVENRALFNSQKAEPLWALWMVQVLGLQGKVDDANELIDQFEPDQNLRYAKGLVLSVQSQKTGSNLVITEYLEQQFAETKDPVLLLQVCRIKFGQHDWKYVADRSKSLVDYFQTADILRFVIVATFYSQSFDLCLELIEANKYMFGGEIPTDIRRLKAICLQEQGWIKGAIAEMEALSSQATQNLLQMAQMYLRIGDLKKLSLIGRELSSKPDLGPVEALQLAHYLRQEDPELAKALFKKAESGNLPTKHLGNLLFTAFNLGLDNETKPIHELIDRASGEETGLRYISLEDLKGFSAQYNTEAQKVQDLFMMGKIPVHLFAQKQNINLVHLYHTNLDDNERQSNVLSKIPIFIRHGGKSITEIIQDPSETNLYIDVTSILLAEHVGILEKVEGAFKTINIPEGLIVSLIDMRDQVLPHQPSQVDVANQLVALVEQNKLKVLEDIDTASSSSPNSDAGYNVDSLARHAQSNGGKVLVFKNTVRNKSTEYVSDSVFVNPRNVVDSLLHHGKISLEKHDESINLLGTEGAVDNAGPDLQNGMPIYCWQNTVDLFANVGILELVCNYFDVYIQPDYLKKQEGDIRSYKRLVQVSNWLANLIEKLRRGINSEKYRLVSVPQANNDDGWKFDPFNNLRTLFTFAKTENVVIWSDDRYLNSFSNRDGMPIVAINDILITLLADNSIDEKTYYSVTNRMRAANLLFIPFQADEICYFLLQAPRDNLLKGTPELSTIKSYGMRVLEWVNFLQKPAPDQANQQGEIAFLLQYAHASQDAIVKLWEKNDLSVDEKQILSNWIVENLFVDYAALANISDVEQSKEHQEYLSALKIMGFLIRGLNLPSRSNVNPESVRAKYLEWVYERLIGLNTDLNFPIIKTSLDLLKRMILENKQEGTEQVPPDVLNFLYQNFCSELPEALRQLIEEDTDFMAAIGVQFFITIDKYQFDPDAFWNTIGEVAKRGQAKATPVNYDHQIVIDLDSQRSEIGALTIYDPSTDQLLPILVPEFGILRPDKDSVISFLKKNRGLFDCLDNELATIIEDVLSASSLRQRVDRFLRWRELNLARHYSTLLEQLRHRQNFRINELLPPNTNNIARFYRINLNVQKPFSVIWKSAVKELLNSHNIVGTISRAWGIPVSLPDVVYRRFDNLDPNRQRKYIKALLENSKSPISIIHLTKLLLHLGKGNSVYRRLGLQKLKYMLTEAYEAEVKAFISVLNWTVGCLQVSDGDSTMIKLVATWSHAHQLYSIFRAVGAQVNWIQKFSSQQPSLPTRLLDDERGLHYDVSYPHNLTLQAMVVNGIAFCAAGVPQDLDDDFRLNLANICFLHVDDRILPNPFLMDDVTTLTDHLESIWSGDRGEKLSDLLGAEISGLLSSSSLHELVEGVLNNLGAREQELSAWTHLFATTRGVCVPEDIKDKLILILTQTDYSELFEKDMTLGRLAFHLSSIIAYTTESDELTLKLTEQFKTIAEKLSQIYPSKTVNRLDEKMQKSLSDTVGVLLEAAFNISRLGNSPEARAIAFVELGKEAASRWDYFAIRSKPVIQTLSEILPVEQSKHMWRLLVFLRTFG